MLGDLGKNYLPENFIFNSKNAFPLLLYKILLDECSLASSQRYEINNIASRLVFEAWPFLIGKKLSFGLRDKFHSVCFQLERNFKSHDKPSVSGIETSLNDPIYVPFLKDVRLNLVKFSGYWAEKRFSPYRMSKIGENPYIETNESWIDYCHSRLESCRILYCEMMGLFLLKRNKNIGDVPEFLKHSFSDSLEYSTSSLDLFTKHTDDENKSHSYEYVQIEGITEDEYENLSRIPIDFLFNEKENIGCIPQLLTLEKLRPSDISVIADILTADQFKRKWLKGIVDFIKDKSSNIIALFDYYSENSELPHNVLEDFSLGMLTSMFIEEYVDRMRMKIALMPSESAAPKSNKLEIFSQLYDPRQNNFDTKSSLAEKYGLSRERIRQLILGDDEIGLNACSAMLKGLGISKNFSIAPLYQANFMALDLDDEYAYPSSIFDEKYGLMDEKTRNFLFDVTDWRISNSFPSYIGPVVFRNCDVRIASSALIEVRKFLDAKILPVSLEKEIISEITRLFSLDNQTINVICDIIQKSDSFEVSFSNSGDSLYTLKWQHLCSVPSRLARILYENGSAMHLNEVYAEYNRRAKLYGLHFENDTDWFTKRNHPYIKSTGKLGMWIFSTEKEDEDGVQLRGAKAELESYIQEKRGLVSFAEAVDYLRSKGFSNTESSIRVYLSNLCRTVKNTSASLFVYKPWIDRFQDLDITSERNNVSETAIPIFIKTLQELHGSASMRELKDAYYKAMGEEIRDVSARTIMDGHVELFTKERIDGSNIRYILRTDCSYQFENDSSPEFHKKIREKIISILENTEGHCLRMSLVIRDVKNLIPKEKHSNIVYTIIRNMDNVEMYEVEGKKFLRLGIK